MKHYVIYIILFKIYIKLYQIIISIGYNDLQNIILQLYLFIINFIFIYNKIYKYYKNKIFSVFFNYY